MKITPNVTLCIHPILIPLNELLGTILEFGFWMADLLYRFAISFYTKLTEYLKLKIYEE